MERLAKYRRPDLPVLDGERLKQAWGLETFHLQPDLHGCAREGWDESEELGTCRAGGMLFKTVHLVKCNILRLLLQMPCYLQNIATESFPLMRERVAASLSAPRRGSVIQTGGSDQ